MDFIGWTHLGDTGLPCHHIDRSSNRRELSRGIGDRHQLEWSIETWAEALSQHVIGLSGGRRSGIVPLVAMTKPQAEERNRQDDDQGQRDDCGHDRSPTHQIRPAGPETFCPTPNNLWAILREIFLLTTAQNPWANKTQQCRQQSERGNHGECHSKCRCYCEPVEKTHPKSEHPEKGDADNNACKKYRSARRINCRHNRCLNIVSSNERLAVSRHNK